MSERPNTLRDKQSLNLELTPEKMLLLKEMLFEYRLTAHEFVGFVVGMWDSRDERLLALMSSAHEYKKQLIADGKTKHLDAEDLYRLISEMNEAKRNK